MDVLCVGAYRAGSTWQYNVASALIERHRGGVRLGFVLGHEYPSAAVHPWRALKAHDRHDAFASALHDGRALALYAYRDLRDVAFSLAHLHGLPFQTVYDKHRMMHVCLDNDAFWRAQPGVLVQRYEALLVADPVAAVRQIAAHLGITLEQGEDAALAQEHSLRTNRTRTEALSQRLLDGDETARRDPYSLLHANHVRSGAVGAWRGEVTPAQLFYLAAVCTDWLLANGYESSPDWHLAVVRERGWSAEQLVAGWLERERSIQELASQQPALLQELNDAKGHTQGLEALITGLHGVIADLQARLETSSRQVEEVGRLGPVALGMARRVQRLTRAATRVLGVSGDNA